MGDDNLSYADPQAKDTPAVRRWAEAYRVWWQVAVAGEDNILEHRLRHVANHAWLDLNEPERASAWSWYRANVDPG